MGSEGTEPPPPAQPGTETLSHQQVLWEEKPANVIQLIPYKKKKKSSPRCHQSGRGSTGHGQPGPRRGKYNLGDREDGGTSPGAKGGTRQLTPSSRFGAGKKIPVEGMGSMEAKVHVGSGGERLGAEPQ